MNRRLSCFVVASFLVVPLGAAMQADAASPRTSSSGGPAVARGTGGAVASVDRIASRAGIAVLRRGGNAIDAAVAMAATLGVTEPYVAGLGGGGFMVVYLADEDRVITIDGRENCPQACRQDMFLDPRTGAPRNFQAMVHSGLSVGVPGNLATWDLALRRYGTLPLSDALRPAERVAGRGFAVDGSFRQQTLIAIRRLRAFTPSRRLFLDSGKAPKVGTQLRNPDLARAYRVIGRRGIDAFYHGRIGRALVHTVRRPPIDPGTNLKVRPGFMTRSDLAGYRPFLRPPTKVSYRGRQVFGMGPPSSGGSTVGEALNILSGYDLASESKARALHHDAHERCFIASSVSFPVDAAPEFLVAEPGAHEPGGATPAAVT